MQNFSIKKIYILTLLNLKIVGMQTPSKPLMLAHRKIKRDSPVEQLGHPFEDKPIKQLIALTEQADEHSCGYRMFFHARCIDIALKRVKKNGAQLHESLHEILNNVGMLNQINAKIKSYLDSHDATFDQTHGINVCHIPGICAEKFPQLAGNILPIMLEQDKTLTVLYDQAAYPHNPLLYPSDFIKNCGVRKLPMQACSKQIDNSPELIYQLEKLNKPFAVAHFACHYPSHFFLASMISDENMEVTLYVIDSFNNTIDRHPSIKVISSKLLSYVQTINNKNNKRKKMN